MTRSLPLPVLIRTGSSSFEGRRPQPSIQSCQSFFRKRNIPASEAFIKDPLERARRTCVYSPISPKFHPNCRARNGPVGARIQTRQLLKNLNNENKRHV